MDKSGNTTGFQEKKGPVILDRHHWRRIERLFALLRPHYRLLRLATFLMLLSLLFSLPMPWISMKAVDQAISNKDTTMFVFLLIAWAIAILLRTGASITQGYCLVKFQLAASQTIRLHVIRHLYHLPLGFFADRQTGYLTNRIFRDTEDAISIFGGRLIDFGRSIISLVFGLIIIFMINWQLALLALAIIPFYFLNQFLFNRKIRAKDEKKREAWAKVGGLLQESLGGMYSVKAYMMQEHELHRFDREAEKAIQKSLDSWFTIHISRNTVALVQNLGPIIVLSYAGYLILNQAMTVGELVGFVGYLGSLYRPASGLFDYFISMQSALVSLRRIFELLDLPAEKLSENNTPSGLLNTIKGEIRFENIDFHYREQEDAFCLKNFTLHIPKGDSLAIVGRSGSGKTTIVNLLLKLYEPHKGRLFIDDYDIREIDLATLRRIICIVPQEPFLFSGSVLENILFGRIDATDDDVIRAAKLANAHQFVASLPEQYQTRIGERGMQLSGGQKQIISIARAFLRDPKILILDEATSAVDSQTEKLIKEALTKLMQNRTTIIISHRLSSIMKVKRIIVLDSGHIVEQGDHDQLFQQSAAYRKLFNEQLLSNSQEEQPTRFLTL